MGGSPDDGRFVALYREGGRLAGALTMNGQTEIVKYRRLILGAASWDEALAFAAGRRFGGAVLGEAVGRLSA